MKIDLNKISSQGLDLTETATAAEWDIEDSEIKYESPVTIDAHVVKYANTANVEARVTVKITCRCSRCLENYTKDMNNKYNFAYSQDSTGQFADISEDVRQELLLGYSLKYLCKPGCKGLCLKCGENLNNSKCNCDK